MMKVKLLFLFACFFMLADATAQKKYGELANGPYKKLVIRGAMVLPGHGGPPVGPYDIVIQGNMITDMIPFDPVTAERRGATERVTGDRVIDATGKYVMPGMIDLHMHLRQEPMPIEYIYYLKLAHGVTAMVPAADRGLDNGMSEAAKSKSNAILAPRLYPIWGWGAKTNYDQVFLDNPANVKKVVAEMFSKGAHVVNVGDLGWNQELLGAVCKEVTAAGGITTYHIPPNTTSVTQAVDAARLGVTMIEHHYAYAESSLDRSVQDFSPTYNYNDENARFGQAGKVWSEANRERLLNEVADSLVAYGVTMLPTRVVYEANRDIIRASSLPWHKKYTHQALMDWNGPNPNYHGAYHYDWTSDDEYNWSYAYKLWGELIYAFNKKGGRVAYGTDDSYIFATPGFSNIRELQLLRETGMHTLEVLKAATYNSAKTLREDKLGLVRPGYIADLMIIDGSPLYNLRYMYSFGALTVDNDGKMFRKGGILHTIKDGIVIENAKLMEEVEKMVAASKKDGKISAMEEPFVIKKD
ncbi:MAG: amidohydrolase family protein [Cyclobacteriaceae bacterium]|nr:amidohydrolase family protein [Cyclobacteriaceae bacterium]